jgi:outer membrane protein assembly factor BamA
MTAAFCSAQSDSIKKAADTTRFFAKVGGKITAKRDWLLGIMLNRTPETGFLTGLHYMQFFKMSRDSNLRTSNLDFTFSYTEKKQAIVMLNNTLIFKNGKYILRGTNAYKKWNEYFWGIGNDAPESNKELVNFNLRQVTQRFSRAITSKLFAGIQYQYYQVSEVSSPRGGLLDSLPIAGAQGSLTSGVGVHILYDSRDNVINSYKGFYLDIGNYVNDKHFGSNYSFNNFTVDARRYIQIFPRQILALQGIVNFNWGEVPFKQMASIGGEKMMRGYYYGRYRDYNMIAFQAEYRFPVWRWVGLCVFGSCGGVAAKVNQFNTRNVLFTYGICFRILWIKHERVNVGFDIGVGKHTAGSYGGTGEVF